MPNIGWNLSSASMSIGSSKIDFWSFSYCSNDSSSSLSFKNRWWQIWRRSLWKYSIDCTKTSMEWFLKSSRWTLSIWSTLEISSRISLNTDSIILWENFFSSESKCFRLRIEVELDEIYKKHCGLTRKYQRRPIKQVNISLFAWKTSFLIVFPSRIRFEVDRRTFEYGSKLQETLFLHSTPTKMFFHCSAT